MNEKLILVNQQPINELPKDLYIHPEALKVFLEMFEGPLDLLLYLIRKQNLDIANIPISKITDQYVSYINTMQTLNIDLAGEYLLMAAVLLEIKSQVLLPKLKSQVDDDEEDDPRQELIQRLIEYEKIKQASQNLNEIPQAYRDYLWVDILIEETQAELPNILPTDLQKAWHTLLLRSLKAQAEHHIKRQELSVREQMSNILKVLQTAKRINFYSLFEINYGIPYIIVNFIAILELGKEGAINIEQESINDIYVSII